MKSHRILIGVSFLVIGFCGVVLVPATWEHFYTLYPTPESETAFLKHYTPKLVIEKFREPNESLANGQHKGDQAGPEFVTHTAGFDWHFAMRTDRWEPLMNALREDALTQLQANGANILRQSGDPHSGFHFDYRIGKSIGTLAILPLSLDSQVHRVMALPKGTVDVLACIEQTERWFPKESENVVANNSETMY